MEIKHLLFLQMMTVAPAVLQAQPSSLEAEAPLLTLDGAVSLALENNRLVKNSIARDGEVRSPGGLDAKPPAAAVPVRRSRRPTVAGIDFTFPAGAFGTYEATGPIPATDSVISTPSQFTTYTTASVDQPITQQHKIGLRIRATELERELAGEDLREERQRIAADVRNAYFDLVATQAAVDAAREVVTTLEEAQRVTAEYQVQQVVLRADALEVDARLLRARYELSMAENGLATQSESLNQLLGRDLATPFRVDTSPEERPLGISLDDARRNAMENRPEVREARLNEQQADVDRRIAKAEYIPDLSLSVRYVGLNNVEVLPTHVGMAGFLLTWEPFTWGRRGNAVAEKTRTLEQARNGVQETESQIEVEVGMKYRKWQEAGLLLTATRIANEAAVEQFRLATNRYKEQAVLVRDLLQAQARTADASHQYQEALSSYWSALADLNRAMGEE